LRDCPNKQKFWMGAFFVRITLSNKETEMKQQMPIKQHKWSREEELESLSALFGSPAREQKQAEKEEQEQLAACPYCRDAGPQGLPCCQCGVDDMVYNDLLDTTNVVPKSNKDAGEDDADDEEES